MKASHWMTKATADGESEDRDAPDLPAPLTAGRRDAGPDQDDDREDGEGLEV